MTMRKLSGISFVAVITIANSFQSVTTIVPRTTSIQSSLKVSKIDDNGSVEAREAFERTAAHLKKLTEDERLYGESAKYNDENSQMAIEKEILKKQFLQRSANSLKAELKTLKLPRRGRKPDLAARLAEYEVQRLYGTQSEEERIMEEVELPWTGATDRISEPLTHFAGLRLSAAAGEALGKAQFSVPSPVQRNAIPSLYRGESAVLHAETGSGKTLAYLLPVTERLWQEFGSGDYDDKTGFCVILTPTRELAAQVAGIAQVLAPPGAVRFVAQPTNLLRRNPRERGELDGAGGFNLENESRYDPRVFVGSAKTIMLSLYGDGKMPAPPTPKPDAKYFLRSVRWLVLDEVDRVLHVKKTRSEQRYKLHEKPAAVVTSAVARLTLGRAQIIAASATVGRPLKRELCRVLGLASEECPRVIRGGENVESTQEELQQQPQHSRAVTIPSGVRNYVTTIEGTSSGMLLTTACQIIKALSNSERPAKILLVLTRACGMTTQNTVGALKFFGCKPEPQSLLDALEADGTDRMIRKHRQVSGSTGIGETQLQGNDHDSNLDGDEGGYVLVTGEDTVRGLHLDGLEVVITVGRPHGPDEYTHIAGRTGRAGRNGRVYTVVSEENGAALKSWERMLDTLFVPIRVEDIAKEQQQQRQRP